MSSSILKVLKKVFRFNAKPDLADSHAAILDEYARIKPIYEDFCTVVQRLLEAFLHQGDYKFQINCRVKSLERLQEKLVRKSAAGSVYRHLSDIEDLTGLRVVFYSETDKLRFLKEFQKEVSGLVKLEEKKSSSGYEAVHMVMSLGPRRLQLSEYKRFEGLKAEIQTTTILRHAWSELEHDFIYKDIGNLKSQNPQKFASIQQQLADIMEKHIKQASLEFDRILADARDSH